MNDRTRTALAADCVGELRSADIHVMFENTTRSAIIVFRFSNEIGDFDRKRHTRFAYVARIGPCTSTRDASGTAGLIGHGWFLSGVPAPLPGRSLRTDLARFSASANDNFGQTTFVIRFSPVTDAIGRIRRCQRSTCVTAALPAPKRGKRNYARDFSPRTVGMIANRRFCVNGAPAQTGTRCRTLSAKTQIPRRVCKHGTESAHYRNAFKLSCRVTNRCRFLRFGVVG